MFSNAVNVFMFNYWTVCHLSITGWFVSKRRINWLFHCPASSAPVLNKMCTCQEEGSIGLYIPDGQEISRGPRKIILHCTMYNVQPNTSRLEAVYGHYLIIIPSQGCIKKSKNISLKGSVKINTSLSLFLNFPNSSQIVLLLWRLVHDGFSRATLYSKSVSLLCWLLIPMCIVIFETLDQLSVRFHETEHAACFFNWPPLKS